MKKPFFSYLVAAPLLAFVLYPLRAGRAVCWELCGRAEAKKLHFEGARVAFLLLAHRAILSRAGEEKIAQNKWINLAFDLGALCDQSSRALRSIKARFRASAKRRNSRVPNTKAPGRLFSSRAPFLEPID
ncbi:MAG: hypothetical protein RR296_07780 [Clostridia bacterium]